MSTIIPSLSISLASIHSSFPSSLSTCLYRYYFHINFFRLFSPCSKASYSLLFIVYLFLSIYCSRSPPPPPLFMSPESCLDLILSFVGTRDIRLITTSLPCSKCFRVNDHGCRIIVTFQVQGTITMWLTLTQNLIKWTENSKVVEYITLPFALQRLVIPMKFLNYMWALNLLSHSTWSYYPVVPRYANAWSNEEVP